MTNFQDVVLWMTIAGQEVPGKPVIPDPEVRDLRRNLMEEELKELLDAMEQGDLTLVADGVADLLYVTYGTAAACGIDADVAFLIAQDNNLSKFIPCPDCSSKGCERCLRSGLIPYATRFDGKILKSPNWKEPDFEIATQKPIPSSARSVDADDILPGQWLRICPHHNIDVDGAFHRSVYGGCDRTAVRSCCGSGASHHHFTQCEFYDSRNPDEAKPEQVEHFDVDFRPIAPS